MKTGVLISVLIMTGLVGLILPRFALADLGGAVPEMLSNFTTSNTLGKVTFCDQFTEPLSDTYNFSYYVYSTTSGYDQFDTFLVSYGFQANTPCETVFNVPFQLPNYGTNDFFIIIEMRNYTNFPLSTSYYYNYTFNGSIYTYDIPITPLAITSPFDTEVLTSGYVAVSGTCNHLDELERRDIYVFAQDTATGFQKSGNTTYFCQDNDTFSVNVPEVTFALYDGNWDLYARACGQIPYACAGFSPVINITIGDIIIPAPPEPECSLSLLSNCFINAFNYLFRPSQETFNNFKNLTLVNRFPFSYFFDLKNTIDNAVVSNEDNFPSLTITAPMFGAIPIFNLATVKSYVGETNFTIFRTLLIGSIWLLFGLHIFHKIKDII